MSSLVSPFTDGINRGDSTNYDVITGKKKKIPILKISEFVMITIVFLTGIFFLVLFIFVDKVDSGPMINNL